MKFFHPKRISRYIKEKVHDIFFYYILPDKWEIKYRFKKRVGYSCNLKNPKSFNEKIQWIKLYDRNPIYPKLIDKLEVKKTVSEILGNEYVIPTLYGGYSRFVDIPFDKLPNQFVIKCNHDAASVIVCKDKNKFDYEKAKKKIERALHANYYHSDGKQWGYKNIKPQVFVEKYMQDGNNEDLRDYKFMMFNGECKCVFVCADRNSGLKVNFYDVNWNLLPFTRHYPNTDYEIPKPQNLEKMLEIAKKLVSVMENPFVRIDLYDINDNIYFGEYTFYPGGGFEEFSPLEWDYKIGEWLDISKNM